MIDYLSFSYVKHFRFFAFFTSEFFNQVKDEDFRVIFFLAQILLDTSFLSSNQNFLQSPFIFEE